MLNDGDVLIDGTITGINFFSESEGLLATTTGWEIDAVQFYQALVDAQTSNDTALLDTIFDTSILVRDKLKAAGRLFVLLSHYLSRHHSVRSSTTI